MNSTVVTIKLNLLNNELQQNEINTHTTILNFMMMTLTDGSNAITADSTSIILSFCVKCFDYA